MNEFTFASYAQEPWLTQLMPGQTLSAAELLIRCEGADEEQLEEIFFLLEEKNITPDIGELPIPALVGDLAPRLQMEQKLAQQGLPHTQLEPTDPLRVYLEELAQLPVCGDVCALAETLTGADGALLEEIGTKLVNLSLSRVVQLACQYTGRGVLLLDLIQEGSLGLWSVIQSFHGSAAEFEAYRDAGIRFYMAKAVILQAHATGVGQKLRTAAEDYRCVDERLLGELGRNPTLEEMAEAMHMSVEQTRAVAETLENARIMKRTFQPEPEELPQEEDQAVEDTAYFQMRQRIAELLSGLSEQDAKLLTLRYGLEGGAPMTPQQTAQRLGITADEVVAKEGEILSKLRQQSE